MLVTEELINKLASPHYKKSQLKLVLSKAISSITVESALTEDRVLRLAKLYLKDIKIEKPVGVTSVDIPESEIKINKRGRKPLHRGKLYRAGTKHCRQDFWKDNLDPEKIAKDDLYFPKAQPGGNYALVKDFLRNEWKNVETFKLNDLKMELKNKYPERCKSGEFRVQRWGNAHYWQNNGEIAIKPLWRNINRFECRNLFAETT